MLKREKVNRWMVLTEKEIIHYNLSFQYSNTINCRNGKIGL